MSALGQKQTLKGLHPMSALPPKADIGTQSRNVRFVPKADICGAAIDVRFVRKMEVAIFIPTTSRTFIERGTRGVTIE